LRPIDSGSRESNARSIARTPAEFAGVFVEYDHRFAIERDPSHMTVAPEWLALSTVGVRDVHRDPATH
jgi:hypothetical protein